MSSLTVPAYLLPVCFILIIQKSMLCFLKSYTNSKFSIIKSIKDYCRPGDQTVIYDFGNRTPRIFIWKTSLPLRKKKLLVITVLESSHLPWQLFCMGEGKEKVQLECLSTSICEGLREKEKCKKIPQLKVSRSSFPAHKTLDSGPTFLTISRLRCEQCLFQNSRKLLLKA